MSQREKMQMNFNNWKNSKFNQINDLYNLILFDSNPKIRLNNQPLIKRIINRYRTNRQQTLSNVGASKKPLKTAA